MHTIEHLTNEKKRAQRLSFTEKSKESRLFYQNEVRRITRNISRLKTQTKKEIKEMVVTSYDEVFKGANKELVIKTFQLYVTQCLEKELITKEEHYCFMIDIETVFNTRKTRERYGIQ